ncbi:MAG: hypothetical protein ABIV48_05720 [Pyrinomonadaceae bacterium]
MKTRYSLSKILILFVIVTGFGGIVLGQNSQVLAQAERVTGDKFTFATRTSKGANVYAVNRPSATILKAIDKGLTDLFAVARRNQYRNRLNYSDYSIYIAKADRRTDSSGQYSPDFAVGAAQYAGTDFDQGGYIYAAGMVLANNPCTFVIAEHAKNFDRMSNVVRYEGEHLILYHNDRRRYAATADHSQGGSHPILD